uniref:TPR_REGION domain-containing protein n=1 Tax=Rhabditophanes sp. KR3021 TaxID=114890 RepID=A0AC35TH21_9BILA
MDESENLRLQGNKYFAEKKYYNALNAYTESLAKDSNNLLAISNRAQTLINLNSFDLAYVDAQKALSLDEKHAKSQFRLVTALHGMKMHILAEEAAEKFGIKKTSDESFKKDSVVVIVPSAKLEDTQSVHKLEIMQKKPEKNVKGNTIDFTSVPSDLIPNLTKTLATSGVEMQMHYRMLNKNIEDWAKYVIQFTDSSKFVKLTQHFANNTFLDNTINGLKKIALTEGQASFFGDVLIGYSLVLGTSFDMNMMLLDDVTKQNLVDFVDRFGQNRPELLALLSMLGS